MKTTYFLYLLLIVSSAAHASLDEARDLLKQGHADQALAVVEQDLAKQPNNLQARFLRAQLLAKLNRPADAIRQYEGLTRDYPKLPEPYNNLAVLYASQNDHDKARDALLRALNTHPSYATAYSNLGSIYAKMALSAYNKALELGKQQRSAPISLDTIGALKSVPPTATTVAQLAPSAPAQQLASLPPVKQLTTPIAAIDNSQVTKGIINTLNNWSSAWSAQNVNSYLAHYAPAFLPHNGVSRQRWEAQRRQRLHKPRFIRVTITEPMVKILGDTTAKLSFKQHYESDRFNDTAKKVLLLEKINGQWQILREYNS